MWGTHLVHRIMLVNLMVIISQAENLYEWEILHIINDGSPRLQIRRDLVNEFLSVGGIIPLIRVVADQLALTSEP